eukprot:10782639-Karenia_brevis.AAC.1
MVIIQEKLGVELVKLSQVLINSQEYGLVLIFVLLARLNFLTRMLLQNCATELIPYAYVRGIETDSMDSTHDVYVKFAASGMHILAGYPIFIFMQCANVSK